MNKCEKCKIRTLNAFKELTKEELERLSNCRTTQVIKKGEVLFEEGEYINGIFTIRSGVCKVSKMSANGKDQIINLIKQGDIIGERSLINNEASNLKAVALNDVEVCFIPKEEILQDFQENKNFTMSMLQTLASSLKKADNIIVGMAQKTVKQRLAHTLLYLYDNFHESSEEVISISLTREDIANIIGTATESAIRLLSEFKKKGLVKLQGKEIFILDISKLKTISEGM